MNKVRIRILLVLLVVLSGAGSFFVTRANLMARQGVADGAWLEGSGKETVAIEEEFNRRCSRQTGELKVQRDKLAAMLADEESSDEDILAQCSKVSDVHEEFLRSVVMHVIGLRSRLGSKQGRLLMEHCSLMACPTGSAGMGMRCQCGPRMHGGGGGMGNGLGRGRGGMGMGRGMGRGRMQGMGGSLRLNAEQTESVARDDADFAADSRQLREELLKTRQNLADGLDDMQTADQELLTLFEEMAGAYRRLENRVVEHVLVLRKTLDPDQRKLLSVMCCRAREGQNQGLSQGTGEGR